MTSTFADLYKKGGATAVYVGQDAVHLTWAVFSVLPSEAEIAKVTGSPEWKAAVAKLKYNAINVEVFELGH
jgi:hypothetical protein